MRYRKHRTILLAVLVVAIIGLTALATPAAAAGSTTVNNSVVDADEVGNNGVQVTASPEISFETPGDDSPSVGDSLTLQLDGASNLVEEDAEIVSASVTGTDGNNAIDGLEVTEVRDGGVFTGTDDTIIVNVTSTAGGKDASSDSFTLDIVYDLNPQIAEGAGASSFTDEQIIDVTADTVGGTDNNLADTNVVTLDIQPGSPAELALSDTSDETVNYDATSSVDVSALDQFGAAIKPGNTGVADLKNAQTTYPNITNIKANLTSVPTGAEDFNTTVDLELNGSESASGTKTVNYGDGAAEINTDPTDGTATQYVGNFELKVDASQQAPSSAKSVYFQPDTIVTSFGDDYDADAGSSTYGFAVQDGSSNNLNIAELEVNLNDNSGFSSGLYRGASANGTLSGVSITDTNGNSINSITVNNSFSRDIVVTDNVQNAFTFDSTDAATYNVQASLAGAVSTSSAEDSVVVSPGAADSLALDASNVTFDNGANFGSYTTYVEDAHNNEVDDSSRYSGTNTDVTYTLTDANGDVYDTASVTLSGSSGSPATIGDANDGNTPNLKAGVGGPFTLKVDQDSDKLNTDVATDTFTVFPAAITVTENAGNHLADESNKIDVTLQDAGTDGPVNNVSEVDYTLRLNTEQVQPGADIAASNDLKVEIENEGQLNASNSQQDVTITTTSATPSVDFNSTAAGQFGLEAEVSDGAASTVSATTGDFIVDGNSVDSSNTQVNIDKSFVGTITSDSNIDPSVQLRDKFGNNLGYSNYGLSTTKLTLAGTELESDLETNNGNEFETNVYEADGFVNVSYDTAAKLADTTETGADNLNLTVGGTVKDSNSVDVVHETFALNEGANRFSVPQPADVHSENLGEGGTFTTWNTSAGTSDSELVDLSGTAGDSELHRGIYAISNTQNARLGYDFKTSEQVDVGEATLKPGWNFVGSNYDISDDAETGSITFDEDLLTVDSIGNDPNSDTLVYDGGVGQQQDSTSSLASNVDDNILSSLNNGELGTYWVYVENSSSLNDNTREIVGSEYTPDDRSTAKSS